MTRMYNLYLEFGVFLCSIGSRKLINLHHLKRVYKEPNADMPIIANVKEI